MRTRIKSRRDQGNLLVGLLILIVGLIIVVKLWTTCNKLFPAPPAPGGTNNGSGTNNNNQSGDEAEFIWLGEPAPGINLLPTPNTQFILWGMVPTNYPPYYFTNSGVGYVQVLDPNNNTGLDYNAFSNTMFQRYGIVFDTNNPYQQVDNGSQSAGYNTNTGHWQGGPINQPYAGYITVGPLMGGDPWVTMYLQKSTNGVDWFNVSTNYIKSGEFQLFMDLGYDKMALYRTQIQQPFVNPAATTVEVK